MSVDKEAPTACKMVTVQTKTRGESKDSGSVINSSNQYSPSVPFTV